MKPKDVKRAEAEERNAKFAALTTSQKLDKLDKAPGRSLRQRKKLPNTPERE